MYVYHVAYVYKQSGGYNVQQRRLKI